MLQWNELRITPDGKYLIVDLQVQSMTFYENVYLSSLYLNIYNKPEDFISPTPDSKSIKLWEYDPSTEGDTGIKRIRKFIDIDGIQTNSNKGSNLFFLYAISNGEPSESTPCGCKDQSLIGIVYNKELLFRNSMSALNTMDSCVPSINLINYILATKAFEMSIKTGDYRGAIYYWNTLFNKELTINKSCGCYGY